MTANAMNTLPAFTAKVDGQFVEFNINNTYQEILEEIREHCDDISHTDEWSYHASSTLEVLYCRCLDYLKELICELTIHALSGNDLAKKHLKEASKELEWKIVNIEAAGEEDECVFTDSEGNHFFQLRNPSEAAKELWTICF